MSTENNQKNIYYLEELSDYKVANKDKDVRGWDVKDVDGRVVGKVDNLLVNKTTEKVVYLDVEVDQSIIDVEYKPYSSKAKNGVHDFINKDGENHLIIPIGLATLDLDNETVSTSKINHETFAKTKRLKKGTPIFRDYEVDVFDNYVKPAGVVTHPTDDSFYNKEEFNNAYRD